MEPEQTETSLERDAMNYLKKHKIVELFQNMTAMLVFNRPKNPKNFLATYLDDLNQTRVSSGENGPCLMDNNNILSLFRLLDPTNKGYISGAHYKQAMKTLGIRKFELCPPGTDTNQILFEVFERQVKKGLRDTWATFSEKESDSDFI